MMTNAPYPSPFVWPAYRLWAASGQAALENANVCLLNATTTGTEILKNLILPGKGLAYGKLRLRTTYTMFSKASERLQ